MWTILLAAAALAADLDVSARLIDATGGPVSGEHALSVALYDEEQLGTEVFRQTFADAAVIDGYAQLRLSGVPDDELAGALWLEWSVDGVVLGERQPLATSPRAVVAGLLVPPADALQSYRGALRLPDGSSLASCAAYAAHAAWRGETWQPFWIDPDGSEGAIAPMALLCDMDGGWAVWEAAGGPWGWDRDGRICYDIEVFTEGQAWQMSRYPHTEHKVETDVDFYMSEDDSTSTSAVYLRDFGDVADAGSFDGSFAFSMSFPSSGNNHVDIRFSPDDAARIRANCSSGTNACGSAGVPANGADSVPLFITRIDANPNCSGSSTNSSEWHRNATAFQGSRYQVFLR